MKKFKIKIIMRRKIEIEFIPKTFIIVNMNIILQIVIPFIKLFDAGKKWLQIATNFYNLRLHPVHC